MRRILVVTNCLTGGGAERSMNLLVNELYSRGLDVALVPVNKSVQDLVIPVCPVLPLNRTWNGSILDFTKAYFRFLRILKSWKPEVVILNCDLPELLGALCSPFIPRLIVVEHASHPFASRILLGKVIRRILKLAKAEFVAVSTHLDIWQVPIKPQAILLNAINYFEIDSSSPNANQKSKLRNVVFVGRLATIPKRPQMMLEIAKEIQNKVVIIGDGSAKEEISLNVIRESLNVEMLGYRKNPWECLDQSDLLIVPSLFEGDGMVIVEAIERDLPLLVTDIPDFRRFGFPESNYCIDSTDFVQRIKEYESKIDELRVPIQIRTEVLNSRTPKAVGDSWVSYLDQKVIEY